MNHIKDKFASFELNDAYQRIDDHHILDIYLGKDILSRHTLFFVSIEEPVNIISSQIIQVNIGKRKDERWGVTFSLIDNEFDDIFTHFCNDMIESSRYLVSKSEGTGFICDRYNRWQEMLSKTNGEILSYEVIKGLVGELYFLTNQLLPLYGEVISVNSWTGPQGADQDFVLPEYWYEIKTLSSGAEIVRISSIEQLDTLQIGELVLIYLDKTSSSDSNMISINKIYSELISKISNKSIKKKVDDLLLHLGYYYREEYNRYNFKLSKVESYVVDSDFPCLRKNILSPSIVNAKYNLSISYLSNYKKG